MTITFHCDCGKRLNAKDEYVGKRARCPQCGKTVTVPAVQSGESADLEADARPTRRRKASPTASPEEPTREKQQSPSGGKAKASARSRLPILLAGTVGVLVVGGAAFYVMKGGDETQPTKQPSPARVEDTTEESESSEAPAQKAKFFGSSGSSSAAPTATSTASADDSVAESSTGVPSTRPAKDEVTSSTGTDNVSATADNVSASVDNADWWRFRGSGGSGSSNQTGLPVTWNESENIVWRTSLPGYGSSSPIVVGDRIYLTGYSGYGTDAKAPGDQGNLQMHVVCVDLRSGDIQWDKTIQAKLPEQKYQSWMLKHGYASATPVSDGQTVYVFFGRTGVFAFDMNGQQLWSADVGSNTHGFGTGASPVLYQNLVIVNASIESGNLIALDKSTGKPVWQAQGIQESWNTPVFVQAEGGSQELVLMTRDKLLAFDPSTGEPLWNCAGSTPPRYICPSVIVHEGIVYALHGYHGPLAAVRPGGRGDVSASHQLWQITKKGSNVPSPVFHEGHIYWVKEDGGVTFCAEAKSGNVVYQERLNPSPGLIYASPLAADGKIYYVSRESGTFVLAAKPEFELLSHNVIATDDSVFNASPVVTESRLLLRSDKFLYCIGTK